MRIKVSTVAISYYEWTSRPLTVGNVEWYCRLKNFSFQWKYVQDMKNNDDSTLPKISKTVSILNLF